MRRISLHSCFVARNFLHLFLLWIHFSFSFSSLSHRKMCVLVACSCAFTFVRVPEVVYFSCLAKMHCQCEVKEMNWHVSIAPVMLCYDASCAQSLLDTMALLMQISFLFYSILLSQSAIHQNYIKTANTQSTLWWEAQCTLYKVILWMERFLHCIPLLCFYKYPYDFQLLLKCPPSLWLSWCTIALKRNFIFLATSWGEDCGLKNTWPFFHFLFWKSSWQKDFLCNNSCQVELPFLCGVCSQSPSMQEAFCVLNFLEIPASLLTFFAESLTDHHATSCRPGTPFHMVIENQYAEAALEERLKQQHEACEQVLFCFQLSFWMSYCVSWVFSPFFFATHNSVKGVHEWSQSFGPRVNNLLFPCLCLLCL